MNEVRMEFEDLGLRTSTRCGHVVWKQPEKRPVVDASS